MKLQPKETKLNITVTKCPPGKAWPRAGKKTEVVQEVDAGLVQGRKLAERRNPGGADGGRNQGGANGGRIQGGTEGGRIHDRGVRWSSQPGIQIPARKPMVALMEGGAML